MLKWYIFRHRREGAYPLPAPPPKWLCAAYNYITKHPLYQNPGYATVRDCIHALYRSSKVLEVNALTGLVFSFEVELTLWMEFILLACRGRCSGQSDSEVHVVCLLVFFLGMHNISLLLSLLSSIQWHWCTCIELWWPVC